MCGNTTRRELASPDGKYTATSFIRDCGATTGFSPQVHLRQTGEKLDSTGNVFIGNRSDEIEIYWLSSDHLVIVSDCEIIHHISRYEGIRVSFCPSILNR